MIDHVTEKFIINYFSKKSLSAQVITTVILKQAVFEPNWSDNLEADLVHVLVWDQHMQCAQPCWNDYTTVTVMFDDSLCLVIEQLH